MLQIQHLIKYYGKKQILHDVSFELDPGDICAFIGSNGAGKTTTIKSALGLIPFDGGKIFIGGHDIERNPWKRKSFTAMCRTIRSFINLCGASSI